MANLYTSAGLNTLSYIARSERICRETPYRVDKYVWDATRDYLATRDGLQMAINTQKDHHISVADCLSKSAGCAVSAENAKEHAEDLLEEAEDCRRKAALLLKYAHRFKSPTFFEMADKYTEEAVDIEDEASRVYEWAWEQERNSNFWRYEAEEREETEHTISKWMEIYEVH